ncbi:MULTISPECIES: F0F1 ATP synthase subunit gamma [Holospora]|uniref:ATP synthase gamma chain n=2 Tax=Holospora TaxID=44747 RepID=A0A061JHE4_9PROT|nr:MULTISPECIES: FoF1 ATP synthase subunit gamma [Holospora]ETZ04747.1 ATP synthase gamma chain [Holospora undulata HU1]GAJ45950.1 ATP synthase gamma chain [Holospora elegans E1]
MITLKELRTKRKSVAGIEQLTKALKMVSQTKLLKAQHQWRRAQKEFKAMVSRLEHLRYFDFLTKASLEKKDDVSVEFSDSSFVDSDPKHLIVLASDRGFCGGFNGKIQKEASDCLLRLAQLEHVTIVGKKIVFWAQQEALKYPHIHFEYLYNIQNFSQKEAISWLEEIYKKNSYNDLKGCYVLYMHYINAISQQVELLPLAQNEHRKNIDSGFEESSFFSMKKSVGEYFHNTLPLLLPDSATLLKAWEKMCICKHFISILQEHLVSEHSARMMAMEKAGDNATELLLSLQKQYNYLRQNQITKELVEITVALQSVE